MTKLNIISKIALVILIMPFFIFNGWYFYKCIIEPHYYQLTDFSQEDNQLLEQFYNIDLPSNTKFIKAEQYETGIGNQLRCCTSHYPLNRKSLYLLTILICLYS